MKALVVLAVLALVVIAGCGPSAPDPAPQPKSPVTEPVVTPPPTTTTAPAEPTAVVSEDVASLEQELEELDFSELDSLDAELSELETLDY